MTTKLSKSKILSGLQCEKRLWLEVHKPEEKAVSADTEYRFNIGHEVNDVARSLYEDGHLIELVDGDFAGAMAETKRVLSEAPEKSVFEATFSHQGVLIRADVLVKGENGYRLIEVKSSTSVKSQYRPDCAVQAWVLEGNGLPVERVELAHIDNKFVYGGDGDYHGLLHHEDLMEVVAEQKQEVAGWVERFQQVLTGGKPDIDTGEHCHSPYSCPFIAHCSGPSAEYPLTTLPGNKQIAKELMDEGIADIRDIPEGRLRNAKQEWVRRVTKSGTPERAPEIASAVDAQPYPRYYLDFETIAFAVPIWKDTRPYQAQPFQWSCHREEKTGEITHAEFLDTSGVSPMRQFIESLLRAVGKSGAIFVYSSYEKTCLSSLANRFPDLADDIAKVIARLVDLLPVARRNYYHRDMHGKWSLKNILPTIAPHLDYGDLGEVKDGTAAGIAYREIIHDDTEPARAQSLVSDLLKYCKRDTEALIALVEFMSTGEVKIGVNKNA